MRKSISYAARRRSGPVIAGRTLWTGAALMALTLSASAQNNALPRHPSSNVPNAPVVVPPPPPSTRPATRPANVPATRPAVELRPADEQPRLLPRPEMRNLPERVD